LYMVLEGETWYSLEPNSRKKFSPLFLLKTIFFNHLFFPSNFKSYCHPLACLIPFPFFLSLYLSVHSVFHVAYSSILKVRTAGSSKTQVPFYPNTWHHIPEDSSLLNLQIIQVLSHTLEKFATNTKFCQKKNN
jgi:hypothetical protein